MSNGRPNVLLVVCDQLRADVLGTYGGPVPTPNIDSIAERGVRFANATCPTPVCSPARASLSTGQYPHAHGITHNVMREAYPAVESPPTERGITADDRTIGRTLHENGYDTHHYGKWHLEDGPLPYYPDMYTEHGAYAREMTDRFREVTDRPREEWMDWYGWKLPVTISEPLQSAVETVEGAWDDLRYAEFVTKMGRLDLPTEEVFDIRVADRAVDRIGHADDPFFITCSFNYPHDPNVVPSPYYEAVDPDAIELPAMLEDREARFDTDWSREVVAELGEPALREFVRCYRASVRLVDDQVGRLLDALEARGVREDTVVCFLADHGDMCGDHGMVWKSTSAFYEGVFRVPLLLDLPAWFDDGGPIETPCGLTDVFPTLCDLADVPVPETVQGESLVPYVTGAADGSDRCSFGERVEGGPLHTRTLGPETTGAFAIRTTDRKFVRYPDGTEFYYDLASDPGETKNLVADPAYADRIDELRDRLAGWLRRTDYPGDVAGAIGRRSPGDGEAGD